MVSDLTYKIVAFSEIDRFDPTECIDWAIEMLELGYESPNLIKLAGCYGSKSYFEVEPYIEPAVRELRLSLKTGEDAIISYSYFFVSKIANRKDVRNCLAMLYGFCHAREYDEVVLDFFLLHWAWGDIDCNGYQHYWDGADISNIEETTVTVAIEWVKKYKNRYSLDAELIKSD